MHDSMSGAWTAPDAARQRDAVLHDLADTSRRLIAVSCVALGICGVVAPRPMARLLGDEPDIARRLAARDLVIGFVLLRSRSPVPLMVRALADASDAMRLRERSPLVAVGALLFGLWSVGTAAAQMSAERRI